MEHPPLSGRGSGLGNGFALTGLLSLPEQPGETYLGQQFSLCGVTNTHSRPLKKVALTVELRTPRVRHVFVDKRSNGGARQRRLNNGAAGGDISPVAPQDLAVDAGLDMVIEHLLAEPGTHKLRVTVSYIWPEWVYERYMHKDLSCPSRQTHQRKSKNTHARLPDTCGSTAAEYDVRVCAP